MTPEVNELHKKWKRTEAIIGFPILIALVFFVVFFVPDKLPTDPRNLLLERPAAPQCDLETAFRSIDLTEELSKPEPDLTRANLRGEDFSGKTFTNVNFVGADLSGANLSGAKFDLADLECASLIAADATGAKFLASKLTGAKLNEIELEGGSLQFSRLVGADLSGANLTKADLREVDFTGAILGRTRMKDSRLGAAKLAFADFRPVDAPVAGESQQLIGLEALILTIPEFAGLNYLAKAYDDAGLNDLARKVRSTSSRWQRHFALENQENLSRKDYYSVKGEEVLLGWVSADGSDDFRPFWILVFLSLGFAGFYWIVLLCSGHPTVLLTHRITCGDQVAEDLPVPARSITAMATATLFSLSNALLIAIPIFNILDLAAKGFGGVAPYQPGGWIKVVATGQSLLTIPILINWL